MRLVPATGTRVPGSFNLLTGDSLVILLFRVRSVIFALNRAFSRPQNSERIEYFSLLFTRKTKDLKFLNIFLCLIEAEYPFVRNS